MSLQAKPTRSQEMNNDIFQRFCRSMTPSTLPDAVLDEWLTQDLARAGLISPTESSVQSSPEVSSPHDVFLPLSTPVSVKEEPIQSPSSIPTSCFFGDLATVPMTAISPALIVMPQMNTLTESDTPPSGSSNPSAIHVNSLAVKMGKKRTSTSSSDETSGNDELLIKRQKNTDAARRSRLKKVQKMEALEKRVAELERVNARLLLRAAILESEKSGLQQKETARAVRIELLEAQLTDAHKSMAKLPTKS